MEEPTFKVSTSGDTHTLVVSLTLGPEDVNVVVEKL